MDCPKEHNEKNNYQRHALQPLSESFKLNETAICDIKCLNNGEIVATFYKTRKVVTFSVSGQQINAIELETCPWTMHVMDTNTVAVLLDNKSVAIVDIKKSHVQYIRDIGVKRPTGAFLYTENQFYVGDGLGITVVDMSGIEKRHIPLSFIPYDMCYDDDSQRIYCTSTGMNKVICIDRDGKTKNAFDSSIWKFPQSLTLDKKGNILVLCVNRYDNTGCIIEVAANGKSKGTYKVKRQLPMIDQNCFFCFHRLTNSVVIGEDKTVSIHKMESNV